MERQYTNTSCPLYGSKYCHRLHMLSCQTCPAKKPEQAAQIQADLDAIDALVPGGDLSALFHAESCVLCKDKPGKRVCYALADLGNPEPPRESKNFLGIKGRMRAGSLLAIQMSCCADCRRRYRLITYLPTVLSLAIIILALALMSYRPLRESLVALHPALPLCLFLGVLVLALVGRQFLRKGMIRTYGARMYLNILEQPFLAKMAERGWFELQRDKEISQLVFARERRKEGLYTR